MSDVNEYLRFVETVVYDQIGEHLSDLQRTILSESLQGTKKTYDEIAAEYGYSSNYIKQGVGPKLWKLLSQAFGEKVTKSNVRATIERRMLAEMAAQIPPTTSLRENKGMEKAKMPVSSPEATPGKCRLPTTAIALELPQDSVPLDSQFYIERVPHEQRCYQEIVRPGAFIRIKAPRQMGKSSLMNRILERARECGCQSGLLHFQQVEESLLSDLNRLLRWFCANLAQQLGFPPDLDDYWDEDLGSKMSCTLYIEGYILERLEGCLVLALEEVNEIIDRPQIAEEFFTLLRFWHERTKTNYTWQKLRLIMVHSTEIYIPLDINQSPLNVGLPIELQPFTAEQVAELVRRHQLNPNAEQLRQLRELIGGHPYLVRLALYHLANQDISWEFLMENAATDAGIYGDHLHRHLRSLQQYPALALAFQKSIASTAPVQIGQVEGFKLHSMGLVDLKGDRVTVSCELYRQYFRDRLESVTC